MVVWRGSFSTAGGRKQPKLSLSAKAAYVAACLQARRTTPFRWTFWERAPHEDWPWLPRRLSFWFQIARGGAANFGQDCLNFSRDPSKQFLWSSLASSTQRVTSPTLSAGRIYGRFVPVVMGTFPGILIWRLYVNWISFVFWLFL